VVLYRIVRSRPCTCTLMSVAFPLGGAAVLFPISCQIGTSSSTRPQSSGAATTREESFESEDVVGQ
jgi:hypothetical protein